MNPLDENNLTEQKKTLYLFIDESGNFDFSPKGTKTFVLSAFATFDPVYRREELVRLRYELLADGYDHEHFHATEDAQHIRDKVFAFINSIRTSFEVHAVVARKNRTHPSLYIESYKKGGKEIVRNTGAKLYTLLCTNLLGYVFRGKEDKVNKIIVVTSSLFVGEEKKVMLRTIKRETKKKFPHVPFEIYMHKAIVDLNCQLADYCCWAIFVKKERKEERPFAVISDRVLSLFDIFKDGETEYYSHSPK